jgi:Tfp pilus assembly protein PilX
MKSALIPPPRRQQGLVLFIALIMLVALSLTGISLFRQVGTGVVIVRNLTFQNAAVSASDIGVEEALTYLISLTNVTSATTAYFPRWCQTDPTSSVDCNSTTRSNLNNSQSGTFDPKTYDWTGTSTFARSRTVALTDQTGHTIRYVIHRMCSDAATASSSNCSLSNTTSSGSGSNSDAGRTAQSYDERTLATTTVTFSYPYDRITVRTEGPNNTVTYTQAMVY